MKRSVPPFGIPLSALALLAGCGAAGKLQPAAGKELPVKPYGAAATPTVTDLLTPDNQARPQRSDELLKKSQERRGDTFSPPPPK